MKKLIAVVTAIALSMTVFAGTAFATPSPDTESPDTESPDTESPDTESPDTESPDTESPDTESPDKEAPSTDATDQGGTSSTTPNAIGEPSASAADPTKSPKTGIDLGTTAGVTATLILGAGIATVVLRRNLES